MFFEGSSDESNDVLEGEIKSSNDPSLGIV